MLKWELVEEYKEVIYEKAKPGFSAVARVTLNRPERMNALGKQLVTDMWSALERAAQDDEVNVVIIKGAGRALSTGASLEQVGYIYGWKDPKSGEKKASNNMRARLRTDNYNFKQKWGGILQYPKLIIAQAHGYLLGQALDTFLNCDFIIGAEDCKFGEVEDRLGIAGLTLSPIWVLRCGLTHALDLCITGRMIDGKEAARIGLINWAVPAEKLEENVSNLAEGLAKYPRDGIALGKSSRQLLYDILGVTNGISHGAVMHSLQTNIHYEEGEFGFFKARRDLGVTQAIAERNKYYELLNNPEGK
jgi:enoyl-CoA hydratase